MTFFVSSQNGKVILLDPLLLLLQSDALVSGEFFSDVRCSSPQEVEGPGPVEGSSGQPPLRSQHRVRTPETRGQPGPRAPPGYFNFPGPGSGREIQSESEGMQPGAPSDPLFIRSSLAQPKP